MGTKISEEFGCRPDTLREKLVDALGRRKGKQTPSAELVKIVYGARSKDASHSSLMMIVKGADAMIAQNKLGYIIKRERDGKAVTLGLHPQPRARRAKLRRAAQ